MFLAFPCTTFWIWWTGWSYSCAFWESVPNFLSGKACLPKFIRRATDHELWNKTNEFCFLTKGPRKTAPAEFFSTLEHCYYELAKFSVVGLWQWLENRQFSLPQGDFFFSFLFVIWQVEMRNVDTCPIINFPFFFRNCQYALFFLSVVFDII